MSRVYSSASAGVPPTNWTTAGAPPIAEPADADPEVGPVPRHRRHDRRVRYAVGRVERRLARGHSDVQEEVLVGRREGEDATALLRRKIERGDLRGERLDEERGRGAIPVVALVAHLHRLADERAE